MKKRFILLLIGGVLCMFTACSAQKELRQATWLWDATLLYEPKDIVSFLTAHHLNTVFVQIDDAVDADVYATFVRLATKADIAVYALDGAPTWATNSKKPDAFFKWLTHYERTYEDAPFTGIHVDVEPYLHPQWATDEAYVIEQFQHFLTTAKKQADALSLPLEADLPFWFDEVSFNNAYGTGNVAQWAIERLDGITLMAYRDDANTIIDITKQEMAFANQAGTPLTIGVETMQSDEGDFVSFYGRSVDYIQQQLEMVTKHYEQDAFRGIAVHHYTTIKTLVD